MEVLFNGSFWWYYISLTENPNIICQNVTTMYISYDKFNTVPRMEDYWQKYPKYRNCNF